MPPPSSIQEGCPTAVVDKSHTAFTAIKNALVNASLLLHPQSHALTCIMTDALDVAIGAVLQQLIGEVWCSIVYFSRKMTPMKKYNPADRELLATYVAVGRFQHFGEEHQHHIATDHKPLLFA
jgi:hypothetical protein